MAGDRITCVVLVRNGLPAIRRTLRELTALPEEPPLIVVDDASDDGTAEVVAAEFRQVELLRMPRRCGAAARNHGARRARTPYVAFCDDDTWWAPGSLTRLVELFDGHPRLAAACARVLVGERQAEDAMSREMAESPLRRAGGGPGAPIMSFLAGATAVRRSAYMEVGGYEPELFIGGEEETLGGDLRAAGWELRYVPDVVVHHRPGRARDDPFVRALGIRNAVWFGWRRRPLRSALRRTVHTLRQAPPTRSSLEGFARAVAGLPWVVRTRRVVPAEVERELRQLDEQQLRSRARDYSSS